MVDITAYRHRVTLEALPPDLSEIYNSRTGGILPVLFHGTLVCSVGSSSLSILPSLARLNSRSP